jgi:hypothetical protein
MNDSVFHRYLLGESLRNIFLRFTIILSSILFVWCGIMLALLIHTRCQRRKQLQKKQSNHHQVYDSNLSLNKSQTKFNRRFHSSDGLFHSLCCKHLRSCFVRLRNRCFSGTNPTHFVSEPTPPQSSVEPRQPNETMPRQSTNRASQRSNRLQIAVQSMSRQSFLRKEPFVSTNQVASPIDSQDKTKQQSMSELLRRQNSRQRETIAPV